MTERDKFIAEIKTLDDGPLQRRTENLIWLSAFANNNPRAPAHWQVDLCYDEWVSRGKSWRYQAAYNDAYESCGFEVSESDRQLALPPNE